MRASREPREVARTESYQTYDDEPVGVAEHGNATVN